VTLDYSRHCFVWPACDQMQEGVIAGLQAGGTRGFSAVSSLPEGEILGQQNCGLRRLSNGKG